MTITDLKPLNNFLIVQPEKPKEKTDSGLYIPQQAQDTLTQGRVVAAGPGKFADGKRVPMTVQEGDTIVYGKYTGTNIVYNNEEYLAMSEDEAFAITKTASEGAE